MSGYNDIQTALSDIQTTLNNADNTTRRILQAEHQRLIDKQTAISEARFGQNRVIDLNRDQMRRTTAYTKVGVVTVISLGIVLVFRLLGDVIPESIMTLIYVMLLSVCLFYGIYVYTDVNGREKTNYNRYDIPAPVINLSDEEKATQLAAAVKTGDLLVANSLSGNTVCSGQGCCSYEQAYIGSSNKCEKCSSLNKPYFVKASNSCDTCVSSQYYNMKTQECETSAPVGDANGSYTEHVSGSNMYAYCPAATPIWNVTTSSCTDCATPEHKWKLNGANYQCAA
jgi:hypothetical protein